MKEKDLTIILPISDETTPNTESRAINSIIGQSLYHFFDVILVGSNKLSKTLNALKNAGANNFKYCTQEQLFENTQTKNFKLILNENDILSPWFLEEKIIPFLSEYDKINAEAMLIPKLISSYPLTFKILPLTPPTNCLSTSCLHYSSILMKGCLKKEMYTSHENMVIEMTEYFKNRKTLNVCPTSPSAISYKTKSPKIEPPSKEKSAEINLLAIFRDNEEYLVNHLFPALEEILLEQKINFFFYENDSKDNTKECIKKFMKNKSGKYLCENTKTKKHGRTFEKSRIQNLAEARNKLIKLGRPFKHEWSAIIDSDIYISKDIFKLFSGLNKPKNSVAIACNGKDQTPCSIYYDTTHYYDMLALIDIDGVCAYENSSHSSCHFRNTKDIQNWKKGKLVEVESAFGGLCFYKSDALNQPDVKYGEPKPIQGKFISEHWPFHKSIRKYGNMYVAPNIIVQNIEKQ